MMSILSLVILTATCCQAAPTSEPGYYSLGSDQEGLLRPLDSRELWYMDHLNNDFSDVVHLNAKEASGEEAKRLLRYEKARGQLIQDDKYAHDFDWPEPYNSERTDVLRQEYRTSKRKGKSSNIFKKLIGRDKEEASSSLQSTVSAPSYESDEDDLNSTKKYCANLKELYDQEQDEDSNELMRRYTEIVERTRLHQLAQAKDFIKHGFGRPERDWKPSFKDELDIIYGRLYRWLNPQCFIEMGDVMKMMDVLGNSAFAGNMLVDDENIQQETAKTLWQKYCHKQISLELSNLHVS